MALHNIPLFRELFRLSIRDEPAFSVELTRELEDLRKYSLNLLIAFLTVHEISASHGLAATTLALLVYTINLHIAINNRFLQSSPSLSRFLHAIPLLGIIYMAVFKFVIIVQSPPIAVAVLLACALPLLTVAVHFAKRYAEMALMPSPLPMQPVAPAEQRMV